MKKTITISIVAVCVALGLMSADILKENGYAGRTGSPGESNCTTGGCHNSFALNTGGGSISLASTPAFIANQYIPGTVYTMNLTVARAGSTVFGLDVEALTSANANAGTLAITNATETQIQNAGAKKNVTHKLNGGLTNNTKTFAFKWTAPASGAATFYYAGVAGNHNGSEGGDYVYTGSLALTAGTAAGIDNTNESNVNFSVYPNPVSEKINVSYSLKDNSKVTCTIYSITGVVVAKLIDEEQNVGDKKLSFDIPPSLTSGTYLFQLNCNGNILCKKIIIK